MYGYGSIPHSQDADKELKVKAFFDSDWNSCPLSICLLSAYMVQLGESPISGRAGKQKTITISSAQTEYRPMSESTHKLKWVRTLLGDLGLPYNEPMTLYCDSKYALNIAANTVFHEKAKHIESDCHNVHDAIKDGLFKMTYVHPNDQIANLHTKALGCSSFEHLIFKFGIRNYHTSTRREVL